jgi:AAA15 family ATPase/GTPase
MFKDKSLSEVYNSILKEFDTGINNLKCVELPIAEIKTLPLGIMDNIIAELKNQRSYAVIEDRNNDRLLFTGNNNGNPVVQKLMTLHSMKNSNDYSEFNISEESDGTRRIIDLLPAIFQIFNDEKVVIIDEIDRSLHTNVPVNIFKSFLKNSSNTKSQLIATTHDTNLLTLELFRRDEIWFIEKTKDSESRLYSLEEFKPRYDKDIRKAYLQRRFGAVPTLMEIK